MSQLVFVYGSLKRGFRHHGELDGARFDGEACTAAAYRLVVVGGYPALAPGDRSIHGELYRVPAALLARLDDFEGEAYRRVPIVLAGGSIAEGYVATEAALTLSTPLDSDAWSE